MVDRYEWDALDELAEQLRRAARRTGTDRTSADAREGCTTSAEGLLQVSVRLAESPQLTDESRPAA